ncbi:NAD(P)-binding protein [Lepidopterella palustris CBS 459.81]|uniref:NAD(P)-binding protein n=1 Tax=Lepidopterella palustris CBS 459.81 TaxID=1314670 RepID=A0A8E2E9F8_9PEZI|nr:NAD(P)-binding protein [Lepidopterella palustris CBS 459.81]
MESAQAAIKNNGLPSTTKSYGYPRDLADNPDIDIVVCSGRVDKHYETAMHSLKAGKDVYCEWPLAKDLAQAQEMESLSRSKGVRIIVGLQAWQSPFLNKIKEIVEGGKIGKTLSTTFVSNPGFFGLKEPENLAFTQNRKNGGNILTICWLKAMEAVFYSLGELESFSSIIRV